LPPARGFLLPTGAIFALIGAVAVVAPQALVAPFALELTAGDAFIAVRSGTGGLFGGIGAFLIWTALKTERHQAGLVCAACVIGGSFVTRGIGIALEGGAGRAHLVSLGLEALGFANALWLLWRMRRG
jgi:hypothetical protein